MEWVNLIRDFLDSGGPVLYPIMGVTFLMWTLILERLWYSWREHPRQVGEVVQSWGGRRDQDSWASKQIRARMISQLSVGMHRSLGMIKTLVALCPLLGLLGTVTGMIEVFEVMAVTGNGNPRAMAAGVSKATIPTMAGMVAALSGLYLSVTLPRRAQDEIERLEDEL